MFEIYNKVEHLPSVWDEIIKNQPFLKKDILRKLEELNPCNQKYHLHEEKKIALVSYQLKVDLFSFMKYFSFKLPVNIIGTPLSVSNRGYAFAEGEQIQEISKYISTLKGFYVVLNSDHHLQFNEGNTLPTYRLEIKWNSLEEYIDSMRSHYRYRMKKAIERFSDIEIEELQENMQFDKELYHLYENVYNNSKEKLEKLPIDFFKNFPAKILKFKVDHKTVAFIQLFENNNELTFLFGGFDYQLNQQYDLYINMLLQIINYGIINGFKVIELGQTAEETKLKLGAHQWPKYMYLHHSNRVINGILNKFTKQFSYKSYGVTHRVFKE